MVRAVVAGAAGRMGREILQALDTTDGIEAVAGIDLKADTVDGLKVVTDMSEVAGDADVIIDFTAPAATAAHAAAAAQFGLRLVTGTTGLDESQQAQLVTASQKVAIVQAPNMSLGVNVLTHVIEQLAAKLSGYDIEIVEMHHRHKVDAPSGTALRLAQSAAAGRDWDLDEVAVYGREGKVGARPDQQIGIMTLRGGDVVGDHTVTFAGPGERVEVTHRAHSRSTFANGAVRAALWVANRPAGLYSMADVLGL